MSCGAGTAVHAAALTAALPACCLLRAPPRSPFPPHWTPAHRTPTDQPAQGTPAGLASLAVWQGHELEAWAAATDHWHPDLLHSGGDDAAYRLWDARQGLDAPAWQDRRTHGAGVCCVASSPHQQAHVCTGSYDDRLRLWDLRAPRRPLLQAQVRLAGGARWRQRRAVRRWLAGPAAGHAPCPAALCSDWLATWEAVCSHGRLTSALPGPAPASSLPTSHQPAHSQDLAPPHSPLP